MNHCFVFFLLCSGKVHPNSMPYQLCRGTVVALLWSATWHSHPCRCASSFRPTRIFLEGSGGRAPWPGAGPAGSWRPHLQLCQEVWKCKGIVVIRACHYLLAPWFYIILTWPLFSHPAGKWWDWAGEPLCWDLFSAPFRRKSRFPQPTLLHIYLCHYDWWGGGALSRRSQPHCQVQDTYLMLFMFMLPVVAYVHSYNVFIPAHYSLFFILDVFYVC